MLKSVARSSFCNCCLYLFQCVAVIITAQLMFTHVLVFLVSASVDRALLVGTAHTVR